MISQTMPPVHVKTQAVYFVKKHQGMLKMLSYLQMSHLRGRQGGRYPTPFCPLNMSLSVYLFTLYYSIYARISESFIVTSLAVGHVTSDNLTKLD